MIKRNFTLREERVDIFSLHKHQFVDAMGYLRPDELYISGLEELGQLRKPIITEDKFVVTCQDMVDALIKLSEKEVDVMVIEGTAETDLLKIINFESRSIYRGCKSILYKTIKTLQNHLWNTEDGKQWYKEIPGADINAKLGTLVGYKAGTISLIKSIGDKDYTLLEQVDDSDTEMTLYKAKETCDMEDRANGKTDNYGGRLDTNGDDPDQNENETPNGEEDPDEDQGHKDGAKPTSEKKQMSKKKSAKPTEEKKKYNVSLRGFSVDLGMYGHYALDLTADRPAILYNDHLAGLVSITAPSEHNPNEGIKFVIQAENAKWSFQVVARSISELLKDQEVESKSA